MQSPLIEEVEKIKNQISFAMPGHKGKQFFDIDLKNDVTEFLGTDNLLNPHGAIAKLESYISKIYGSKESFIITNGSTGAIHIALSMLTEDGDNILIQRNSHKSIYNFLIINNLKPTYLENVYDKERALFFGINTEELLNKIKNNNIKVCVLTSPNYYGGILNLKELIKILHDNDVYVIVDEAHGAHLYFSDYREFLAIEAGADFVINSTHKTIPSLTQSAILHLNTEEFTKKDVLKYINLFHTTSPSYLMMLSIEAGINYMLKNGKIEIARRIDNINCIKKELGYSINLNHETIAATDPLKFLFRVKGISGDNLLQKFSLEKNIRLEMADLYYALAIISPLNTKEEINLLKDAIVSLENEDYKDILKIDLKIPKMALMPKTSFYSKGEIIDIREACGRISKNIIAAYPPGVPLISFGEIFTEDIIQNILKYIEAGIEIIGIENNKIEVVK
ncbi:lysine decarboxylase [Peptoniphilus olsenii]|uniref:Lysine decarboxylase n=2 Tax=Peptoniphilus olsenii TaxID=411570 RepID=A0ABV2J855_9FIRM